MSETTFLKSNPSFSEYLAHCRAEVAARRQPMVSDGEDTNWVIDANSPYELRPTEKPASGRYKHGAVLIHGLLDCPYTLRDLGARLQAQGVFCRSVLLPGHGTQPSDLMNVKYEDWASSVAYVAESLKKEVEHVSLVGFSTGAALAAYHAIQDPSIAKVVMLAPAVKIHPIITTALGLPFLPEWTHAMRKWAYFNKEVDTVKYTAIAFNGAVQVNRLTLELASIYPEKNLPCPLYMVVSKEDEVISSSDAIDFFTHQPHPDSRLLIYSGTAGEPPAPRVIHRVSAYPELNVENFAHISLPFAPTNEHYGQAGRYARASRIPVENVQYGAYNDLQALYYYLLYNIKLSAIKRKELTYNPDFDFTAQEIVSFITK